MMADTVYEVIMVKGDPIRMEIADVPLDDIELDDDNPRLRHRYQNGQSAEDFIRAMPDTPKLRKDIEQNHGLLEKPFLQPNGGGKKKVKEGNRRVVCMRDLRRKYPDDPTWQTLTARVLPADLDPRKLAILLADWHVAGKVDWDAHEKAGQVYHMNKSLGIPFDEILIHLHASKGTVNRWFKAYEFMFERYSTIDGGKYAKDREGKWSYFDELYRSKELRQRLTDDAEFGDRFCRWVGDEVKWPDGSMKPRLPKGETVRRLPAIINSPAAYKAFESQPIEKAFAEAMRVVAAAEPETDSELFQLFAKVRKHCTDIASVRDIMKIRTDKVAEQRFRETVEALLSFGRLAEVGEKVDAE
jgi:hypothetical protein